MSFILGLDVGTASAAGAMKRDGRVQPCALGDRTATLPAIVVLQDDGNVVVGDEAERLAGLELTRVARDLRNNPSLQASPITVGGHIHKPHDLLRALYSSMVGRVSGALGTGPTQVVLTHPALPEGVRCDGVDRIADELFPGALVVPDPVAATVKLACDAVLPTDCLVAVYDLGGGTFDTAIVQRSGDRFSVVGDPGGLADFGGIDIDDLVLDHVDRSVDAAVARLDLSDPGNRAALNRLRAECRDAKERLSYDTEVTIDASLPNQPALVQLTRAELNDMLRPRLELTVDVLRETIDRAGLRSQDVDAVALVGGSSRIPAVVDLLTTRTTMQVLVDPYPELTVALGAAQMVDDQASSPSVFPIADLALPSLSALTGQAGGAGGGGAGPGAGAPTGPGAAVGTSLVTPPVGPAIDPGPGGVNEAAAGAPPSPSNGDATLVGQYGDPDDTASGSDDGFDLGPPSRRRDREGGDPKARALVLVCLVGVLLVVGAMMALLSSGGGGGSDDDSVATDADSRINDEDSTTTDDDLRSPSSSSTSSSSTSSTASSSTTTSGSSNNNGSSNGSGTGSSGTPTTGNTTPTTRQTTTTRPQTTTTRRTTTTRPRPTTTSSSTTSSTTTTTTTAPPPAE
jgi:molecular chaperone DnaK